jgi:predicted DCC family thiol-disulfide oxidoreductase YuxK
MELTKQAASRLSKQVCLLVYDGECRLCVSTKEKLEQVGAGRAGSHIRFLAYQSEEARKALGQDYRPGRPDMAFLLRPSGEVLKGFEAFLPFVPNLPGGKLLLWWLRFPFVRWLAEWGYRMVARHRYRWFGET